MIATFHGSYGTWLDGDIKLLAHVDNVPFSIPVTVCACHGLVWSRDVRTGRIAVVR